MSGQEDRSPRVVGWVPAVASPARPDHDTVRLPDPRAAGGVVTRRPSRHLPGITPVVLVLLAVMLVLGSIALATGGMAVPVVPWNRPDAPPPHYGTTLPGAFTYQQQRSLSCEYASLSIAATMIGRSVSEYDIEAVVPLAENPHRGYRGNIEGEWGNTDDYGVYNEPLAAALPGFGLRGDVIYGGRAELTRELDLGRPTVVWLGMRGDAGSFDAWTGDGARFQLTQWMHVMVAYGYDETFVYLTDPGTAVLRQYDWATFIAMWTVMDGMALSVYE